MTQLVCENTPAMAGRDTLGAKGAALAHGREVALLTAGRDKPYALGLASALLAADIRLDFIGSDIVDGPELHGRSAVRFFNLRDQRPQATPTAKAIRVLAYYYGLIRYAATSPAPVFHILWNNKFELFDRIFLMLYYKLLGKRIVLTVHNVNAGKRDANDSSANRVSLRIQYSLANYVFVHTPRMKGELLSEFGIAAEKVGVIPFGINNTVLNTSVSAEEAKRHLGIESTDKTLLFFGNIAPYKGLEYLLESFAELSKIDASYRLIIAGQPKGSQDYWSKLHSTIVRSPARERIVEKIHYVPDAETEWYFKAADVLILPYTHIFQSGVLFLGYSFGLPAIAADVGSLKEEIVEGRTGFIFQPRDSTDLAKTIDKYFASELFRELGKRRAEIREYANKRYSWSKVAEITKAVYADLLAR